ncbi:unnamed protein product [Heterobilharzia americana]|nr:unnamed protein product [Heterobilharzia americana]
MSKPNLRSEFEADLKLICEGRKTKEDVLRYHLNKYKELFRIALNQASLLDRALAVRLEQEAENVQNISGSVGEMASFASNNIPGSYSQDGVPNLFFASCPVCRSDLVLRQRRNPLRSISTSSNQSDNSGSLETNQAGGAFGGWFVSCSSYPSCRYAIWFPECVVHVRVLPESNVNACSQCRNYVSSSLLHSSSQPGPSKLGLRFRRNFHLPNGYFQEDDNNEYTTCIFCDEDVCRVLGIRIPAVNTVGGTRTSQSRQIVPDQSVVNSQTQSFSTTTVSSSAPFSSSLIHNHHFSSSPLDTNINSNPFPLPASHSSNSSLRSTNFQPVDNEDIDSESVLCNCGNPAIQLTVRKPGPNQGRLFYRCSGTSGNSCDFFLWKSQPTSTMEQTGPLYSSTQVPSRNNDVDLWSRPINTFTNSGGFMDDRTSGVGFTDSNSSGVVCRCGEPAKL